MITVIFLGRIIFGAYFIDAGIYHFRNTKSLTGYAKSKGVPSPELAVILSGAMFIIGGAGIFLNVLKSQSALLIVLALVPITFQIHSFWKGGDAAVKMNEKLAFMKNLALIGALLMMF